MNSRIDRWMQPNGVRAGGQRITNDQMNESWGGAFVGTLFSPSSYGSIAQVTQPAWIEWTSRGLALAGATAFTFATFGLGAPVAWAVVAGTWGGAVAGGAIGGGISLARGGEF